MNAEGSPEEVNIFPKALFFVSQKLYTVFLPITGLMCLARAVAVGMVLVGAGVGSVRSPGDKSHLG